MNGSSSALSLVCGFNASTGQAVAQAPQSTQAFGSTYSISASANPGSPGAGWMQLTGHAMTHEASLQQDCVTTYGMTHAALRALGFTGSLRKRAPAPSILSAFQTRRETGFIKSSSSARARTS